MAIHSFQCDDHLWEQLRAAAYKANVTISEIIRITLEEKYGTTKKNKVNKLITTKKKKVNNLITTKKKQKKIIKEEDPGVVALSRLVGNLAYKNDYNED